MAKSEIYSALNDITQLADYTARCIILNGDLCTNPFVLIYFRISSSASPWLTDIDSSLDDVTARSNFSSAVSHGRLVILGCFKLQGVRPTRLGNTRN